MTAKETAVRLTKSGADTSNFFQNGIRKVKKIGSGMLVVRFVIRKPLARVVGFKSAKQEARRVGNQSRLENSSE